MARACRAKIDLDRRIVQVRRRLGHRRGRQSGTTRPASILMDGGGWSGAATAGRGRIQRRRGSPGLRGGSRAAAVAAPRKQLALLGRVLTLGDAAAPPSRTNREERERAWRTRRRPRPSPASSDTALGCGVAWRRTSRARSASAATITTADTTRSNTRLHRRIMPWAGPVAPAAPSRLHRLPVSTRSPPRRSRARPGAAPAGETGRAFGLQARQVLGEVEAQALVGAEAVPAGIRRPMITFSLRPAGSRSSRRWRPR